jgi:selenocysteine lyase/cysteine desulfurase
VRRFCSSARAAPPGPSAARREPAASRSPSPSDGPRHSAARSLCGGADTIGRLDHASFRAEFPVLAARAYLNAGTDGPLPARAATAARARLEHEVREGRSGRIHWDGLEQLSEGLRARLAALMGASTDEVALTGSATDAINVVLAGLDLAPGDEVLTTDEEHPGLLGPLAAFARRTGAAIRVAPFAEVGSSVSSRTRLVAVSHVSWMTGGRVALGPLRDTGLPLLLDGAQGLGAVAVDVHELGCDFYAVAGQKWLCGPDGTGALFVKGEWIERLGMPRPSYGTLVEHTDPLALEARSGARCFDSVSPSGPALAAAVAALDLLAERGWPAVFADAARGAQDLRASLGDRLVAPAAGTPLVTWRTEHDPEDHVAALAGRGVIVRAIPGHPWIRASVGAWNCRGDLERLLAAL